MKLVDVQSTKYMLASVNSDEAKKAILDRVTKSGKITQDFMKNFGDLIDVELFSTSKNLTQDMIDLYPEYFDINVYVDYLKKLKENDREVDISLYNIYLDNIKEALPDDYGKVIIKSLRNASKEELNSIEVINSVYGISTEIDKLLFLRIKDNNQLINALISLQIVEHNVSSVMFGLLSDEFKEGYLGDEIEVKDFFDAIFNAKESSWRDKMLNKLNNNEIKLIPTSEDLSESLYYYMKTTNELDNLVIILNNEKYYQNTISPSLLKWCLIYKEFNEDQLIKLLNIFKQNGLYFDIKKIAQASDFTKLLELLQ